MDIAEIRHRNFVALIDSLAKAGATKRAEQAAYLGGNFSASYVSQLLGGKYMGDDVARKISIAMGHDNGWMDRPQWEEGEPIIPIAGFATAQDYTRLQLLEGGAGMGDGMVNEDYPEVIREVEISNTELRKKLGFLPAPGRIQLITGRGPSMYPDIEDGQVVAVDTQINFFDGDDFYLININGMTQIKQLQMRPDGLHVVSSNPRFHPYRVENLDEIAIGGKAILGLRVHRLGV